MSLPAALRDIDPAGQDKESARRDLAGRNHALPGHIGFALTEPFQPLDLFRLQHRKHLLASGFDQRMYRLRHRIPQGQPGPNLLPNAGQGRRGPANAPRRARLDVWRQATR
jgi:hypothetical protein